MLGVSAVRPALAETADDFAQAVHSLRILSDANGRDHAKLLEARAHVDRLFQNPLTANLAIAQLSAAPPSQLLEDLAVIDWRHDRDADDPHNVHTRALRVAGYERLQTALKLSGDPPPAGSMGRRVWNHQRARETALFEKLEKIVHDLKDLTARADYPNAQTVAATKQAIAELTAEPAALQAAIAYRREKPSPAFLHALNTVLSRAAESEDSRERKLLEEVDFDRLTLGIRVGASDENNASGSLYEQLEHMDDAIRTVLRAQKIENEEARDRLARNGSRMRRGAFLFNLAAVGAVFTTVGVYASQWLGFHRNFWRALSSWTTTAAGVSVGGFGAYYPVIASPIGRLFIRRSYRDYHHTLVSMLELDPDRALEYVRKLAETPSHWPYTAQQNLALEAMAAVKDPKVTDALMDLAISAVNDKNYALARWLLTEIEERERTETTPPGTRRKDRQYEYTARGEAARAIRESVEAFEAIPSAKFWRQALYLITNRRALYTAGLLGAAGAGVASIIPNHDLVLTLTAAAGGLSWRGLLAVAKRLAFGDRDAYLHEVLKPKREAFNAKTAEMMQKIHGLSSGQRAMLAAFAARGDETDIDRAESADKAFEKADVCPAHLRKLKPGATPANGSH